MRNHNNFRKDFPAIHFTPASDFWLNPVDDFSAALAYKHLRAPASTASSIFSRHPPVY
jgi:hypothetical protein